MSGTLAPLAVYQPLDNNGATMPGGKIYTYASGGVVPATTWTDAALSVANANPIILDSAGRCVIYLALGTSYKFLLKTSADVTVWTQDAIASVPSRNTDVDVTGVAGATLTVGQPAFISDGGGSLTVGTWYHTNETNDYKSSAAPKVGFVIAGGTAGSTVTIRVEGRVTGLTGLVPGSVYYTDNSSGLITSTYVSPNGRAVGIADTSTSIVMMNNQAKGQPTFELAPHYRPGQAGSTGLTTYAAIVSGSLYGNVDVVAHANGTTVETTFSTFTFPANTMTSSASGTGSLKVSFAWTMAANGNTKTVKFYFGANAVTVYTGVQNGGTGFAQLFVTRNAVGGQKISGFFSARNAAGTADGGSFSSSISTVVTADITVKTTGTSGTASNDITQDVFIPEILGL